ncbi:MAG: carboxymuconolactone decarboxylase family protein [Dermatophilaceae bacterium]
MQRIPATTLDQATPAAHDALAAIGSRMGGVVAIHATMASSPPVITAYRGLTDAIREHGTLDGRTREAVALAVAAANGCDYCQAAHTGLGAAAGLDPDTMIRLRAGEPTGDARLDALAAVARVATAHTGYVDQETWSGAQDAGWSDDELAEAFVHIIANVFTNYFNHYAHTELDLTPAPPIPAHVA